MKQPVTVSTMRALCLALPLCAVTVAFAPAHAAATTFAFPARPASVFDIARGHVLPVPPAYHDFGPHDLAVRAFRLGRERDQLVTWLTGGAVTYYGEHVHKEIELDHTVPTYGVYSNQTIYPNLREVANPDPNYPLVLFTPTMFGPGTDCIEAVTTYLPMEEPEIWAWDWCRNISNPAVTLEVDQSFMSTYTATMPNGLVEYTVETLLGSDGKTWNMVLYNYVTKSWVTVYQTSGTRTAGGFPFRERGWDMYEMYSPVDEETNVAVGCAPTHSAIGSDGVAISFDRTSQTFTPASPSNARIGRDQHFHCPDLVWNIVTDFSDWNVTD